MRSSLRVAGRRLWFAASGLVVAAAVGGCGADAQREYAAEILPALERLDAGLGELSSSSVGGGPVSADAQRQARRELREASGRLSEVDPPEPLAGAHEDLEQASSALSGGLLNCRVRSAPGYGRIVAEEALSVGERVGQAAALLATEGGADRSGQVVADLAGRMQEAREATAEGCGEVTRELYAEGVEATLEPLGGALSRLSGQLGRAEDSADFSAVLEAIQSEITDSVESLGELVVPRRVGELHDRLAGELEVFSASFETALVAAAAADPVAFEAGRRELVRAAERFFRELSRIDTRMRDRGIPFRAPPLPSPPESVT